MGVNQGSWLFLTLNGNAKFSSHHCNFIDNSNLALSSDIEKLISETQKKIKKNYGIDLEQKIYRLSKKKILFFVGGPSKERKVSLSTGRAVYLALRKLGYEVIKVDPKIGSKNFSQYNCDLAFNALHGQFGEDGTIQSLLERQKIPYTHSGVKSSAIAIDLKCVKRNL